MNIFFFILFSRIRSSCPSEPAPYMFIVRYWMSKCIVNRYSLFFFSPSEIFQVEIFNPTFFFFILRFINLSCCINQINEENREGKNYILIKKISSPPNNKPKKRLWYLTAVSFHYSKKIKLKYLRKKKMFWSFFLNENVNGRCWPVRWRYFFFISSSTLFFFFIPSSYFI